VAAFRQTTAGRPVPVTLAPVSAADSGRPASMDTRPRWWTRRRTADATAASGSAATWTPPRGEHPAVRTASPGGRSSATTADTLAVSAGAACRAADTLVWTPGGWRFRCRRGSAGGGLCPLPQPAGVPGRSATGGRHVPPAQGGCGGVRGRQRPSGQHPAVLPDAPRTRPRCPVAWTPAGGCEPGRRRRRTPTVRTRGRRTGLWTPAARRRPALRTPATAAGSCGHDGNVTLDSRQHNRPPLHSMSDQERNRNVRHRPAPPWPDRQIRCQVLRVPR
jgi:hypothetical protein